MKPYQWIPPREELERLANERVERLLGCGGWGCAFLLASGRVLKITSDVDEVAAVARINDLRLHGHQLSGIVRMHTGTAVIGETGFRDRPKAYGYIRDAIRPVPKNFSTGERRRRGRSHPDDERPKAIIDMLGSIAVDYYQARWPERDLRGEYSKWLGVLDDELPDVAESIRQMLLPRVVVGDLGAANLGYTESNRVVLYDFQFLRYNGFRARYG